MAAARRSAGSRIQLLLQLAAGCDGSAAPFSAPGRRACKPVIVGVWVDRELIVGWSWKWGENAFLLPACGESMLPGGWMSACRTLNIRRAFSATKRAALRT